MGTKGMEVAGSNVKETVELLNKALADEWLAYYQYWVGALVVRGPLRPDVQKELKEHAEEEFKHAGMLAERIIQLGGTPILNPNDFMKKTSCGYEAPKDPHVEKILEQNVKGEQCAIGVYQSILQKLKGSSDAITYNMIRKIMEDEVEHEQDLQDLQDDIKIAKE
ncbi:MAG: ferritin-like domain-containing protein [Candidatus Micrarchaeia archaeon]